MSFMSTEWLADVVSRQGLGLGLFAVFAGGLLLNLTPCVYPMIPVTLAFFNRQSEGSIRRTLGLAILYAAGLSLSYAILGLFASRTGALFGSWLQSPVVILAMASVIVGLSLSMFGLYELRPPQWVMQRLGQASTGAWGAFLMGLSVGLVAAPCVGPFLVSLMLIVGKMSNPAAGFLLFFTLGFGMGLPSILLAVAAQRASRLPKAGQWLIWVKKGLGVVLLGVAAWLIKPLILPAAFRWLVVLLLLGSGVYLGWLERSQSRGKKLLWVRRVVGIALLAAALACFLPQGPSIPSVSWQPYTPAALQRAAAARKPTLIDVYADWCLPCVELDRVTFRHPEVVAALQSWSALHIDVTHSATADAEALFQKHDIYGVPTVLLIDAAGVERADLRVTGFVSPAELLQRLKQLQAQ